jgi:hypothetical protein
MAKYRRIFKEDFDLNAFYQAITNNLVILRNEESSQEALQRLAIFFMEFLAKILPLSG